MPFKVGLIRHVKLYLKRHFKRDSRHLLSRNVTNIHNHARTFIFLYRFCSHVSSDNWPQSWTINTLLYRERNSPLIIQKSRILTRLPATVTGLLQLQKRYPLLSSYLISRVLWHHKLYIIYPCHVQLRHNGCPCRWPGGASRHPRVLAELLHQFIVGSLALADN